LYGASSHIEKRTSSVDIAALICDFRNKSDPAAIAGRSLAGRNCEQEQQEGR
jgi:hypothetical protein